VGAARRSAWSGRLSRPANPAVRRQRGSRDASSGEREDLLRRETIGLWLLVALAFCAAPVFPPAAHSPDAAAAAKGEVTYERYCVSCHGPSGRADGPLAADLRVSVPDLTTLAERSGGAYPYDRVVRAIAHGEALRGHATADMPAWGEVFKNTEGTEDKNVDAAIGRLAQHLWMLQRSKT
jgi:mono/diheme cytochrome c family protein